jgi:hypothetical protein
MDDKDAYARLLEYTFRLEYVLLQVVRSPSQLHKLYGDWNPERAKEVEAMLEDIADRHTIKFRYGIQRRYPPLPPKLDGGADDV